MPHPSPYPRAQNHISSNPSSSYHPTLCRGLGNGQHKTISAATPHPPTIQTLAEAWEFDVPQSSVPTNINLYIKVNVEFILFPFAPLSWELQTAIFDKTLPDILSQRIFCVSYSAMGTLTRPYYLKILDPSPYPQSTKPYQQQPLIPLPSNSCRGLGNGRSAKRQIHKMNEWFGNKGNQAHYLLEALFREGSCSFQNRGTGCNAFQRLPPCYCSLSLC
ncbi:hypothetical protein CEXT_492001 [Caerostris extrusa]|uniref:Uncharacterized protein n=1 Tax=Caerostris extrusa TaxID=172846 RepID=A0AAV4N8F8_CAEEX|nr:hypothetical protein CEXT_492001 [Caerostris extrusa]